MTILRAPIEIRGDVSGLLVRGMPCIAGSGLPVVAYEQHESPDVRDAWTVDWRHPMAIYAALHWLADRSHPCLWMLPTTHGGRVEAWDGLSAWEVSAILVSVSVGRVAAGKGPVRTTISPRPAFMNGSGWLGGEGYMVAATPVRFRSNGLKTWGWRYRDQFGPETGDPGKLAADRAALADGAALCVDGGIAVEGP